MDFGGLMKRGWQLTWNNKYLYILGFLAALGGSGSSGGGGGGGGSNVSGNFPTDPNVSGDFENLFSEFGFNPEVFATVFGVVVAVCAILLLILVVMWFIRFIAEAGIIKSVAHINKGGTSSFQQAFADGRPYLMKFFFTRLILIILPISISLIALAIGVFLYFAADGNWSEVIPIIAIPIVCLGCLLVPYNVIVNLLYPIAQRGIVFKGLEGTSAIRYAWDFFKGHATDILIFAFLFVAIGFIVGIISLVVALPVFVLSGLPAFFALIEGGMPSAGAFSLLGVGFIFMILISSAIGSVFITFRSATFTLAFLEMDAADDVDNNVEIVYT